jgi:hypothetical protein
MRRQLISVASPKVIGVIALFLVLLFCLKWEVRHKSRFGHFAGYGLHSDIISEDHDLAIPGVRTAYSLVLTNLTPLPTKLEVIKMPGGYSGYGYKYHYEIEKWDQRSNSWATVLDSVAISKGTAWAEPNASLTVWPGQSIYPIGWDALAATEGITEGDTLRIVVFNTFQTSGTAGKPNQIYSSSFVVRR